MSAAATLASSLAALTLMNEGLSAHEAGKHPAAAEILQRAAAETPASLSTAGEYSRLFAAESLARSPAPGDARPLLTSTYRTAGRDDVRRRAHQLWVAAGEDPSALLPPTGIPERFRNFLADARAGALAKAEAFMDGELLEMVRMVNKVFPSELTQGEPFLSALSKELDSPVCGVRQLDPETGAALLQISDGEGGPHVLLQVRVVEGEWRATRLLFAGDEDDSPLKNTEGKDFAALPAAAPEPAKPDLPPLTPAQMRDIEAALRNLAARTPAERRRARETLLTHGPSALPLLEAAALDADPEVSESASELIRAIRP